MSADQWESAFRKQATSDFEIFKLLSNSDAPLCHRIHYLQMAAEKTAKSHMCYKGRPKPTHYVIRKLIEIIGRNNSLLKKYGWNSFSDYKNSVKLILPFADFLENIVPVANNENQITAEYPWICPTQDVIAPCEFDFSNTEATTIAIIQMKRFLTAILSTSN